jgi:hypothetical protein
MKSFIYSLLLAAVFSGCQPKTSPDSELENKGKNTIPAGPQCIAPVPIPKLVTFAGDTIPIERPDVREALEAELMVNTFRHSHTLSIIKNVERWKPLVSAILKETEVPQDFLYLAVIESEFDNNAQSYAGAMGMWQIMEATAKDYKLKMNKDVDMRRDPKLSTIAASKFLKWAYGNLDNWTLAAASYNVGVKGMKNRLEEQQVDNFFDLHLNSETARYVYRIIALKLILEDPKAYGYFVEDDAKYSPFRYRTITVKEDIKNLVDFAKKYKTTYKELRLLNPWFNNTSNFQLNIPRKDSFELRIPEHCFQDTLISTPISTPAVK